jgi:hypothetical protein
MAPISLSGFAGEQPEQDSASRQLLAIAAVPPRAVGNPYSIDAGKIDGSRVSAVESRGNCAKGMRPFSH